MSRTLGSRIVRGMVWLALVYAGPQTLAWGQKTHLASRALAVSPEREFASATWPYGPKAGVGAAHDSLPNAPGFAGDAIDSGNISGTVTDGNGAEVAGALVTLLSSVAGFERTMSTDGKGFFRFGALGGGSYNFTIKAPGFAVWASEPIPLRAGQSFEATRITLQIAMTTTNVDVTFSRYDVAEEQLKAQEHQRVLGVFPNFYVSYVWDAVPLTAGQKFRLALREQIDPEVFVGAAASAGLEMGLGYYRGYGNGAKGFFTRMGAAYGDGFDSALIAGAILPSLLHQDPRYFYKGTGSKRSRALYAVSTVAICRGDNGQWQPNYSYVLGNLAAAGLSNAYYPAADRGATLTLVNSSISFAVSAVGNLLQEFVAKELTPAASHSGPQSTPQP